MTHPKALKADRLAVMMGSCEGQSTVKTHETWIISYGTPVINECPRVHCAEVY
jgi:hypothetical protein